MQIDVPTGCGTTYIALAYPSSTDTLLQTVDNDRRWTLSQSTLTEPVPSSVDPCSSSYMLLRDAKLKHVYREA